jgi:hypothetical protein
VGAVGVLDLAEVRSGLIRLDRRLDELARGLGGNAEAPGGTSVGEVQPAGSTGNDMPASIPLVSPGAEVPPWMSHSSVAADDGPAAPPVTVAPAVINGRADAGTAAVARAEEEAAQILARVHQRADEVRDQIRELVMVRDHLRGATEEIMASYGEALTALDLRFEATVAAAGIDGDPARAGSAVAATPSGRRFVGDVSVVAGPFGDLDGIRTLENALVGIAAVERVSLAGFTDRNVHMDLSLSTECDLAAELTRTLPFACETESASDTDLTLRLKAA